MGLSFEIRTANDFFEKLRMEHEEVANSPTNSRHAINAALTAYHLLEWLWEDRLDNDPSLRRELLGDEDADVSAFRKWAFDECASLKWMHSIANGSKHFRPRGPISDTYERTGDFAANGDWHRHDWDISRLVIETKEGDPLPFDLELDKVVDWWQSVFSQLPSASPGVT